MPVQGIAVSSYEQRSEIGVGVGLSARGRRQRHGRFSVRSKLTMSRALPLMFARAQACLIAIEWTCRFAMVDPRIWPECAMSSGL